MYRNEKRVPSHTKRFLWEFIPELGVALTHQLHADRHRFGDSWKNGRNTEALLFKNVTFYYTRYLEAGEPIPWLKVIGTALIGWVHSVYNIE